MVKEFQLLDKNARGPLTRWINDALDYGWPKNEAFPKTGSPTIPSSSTATRQPPNYNNEPFKRIPLSAFSNRVFAGLYERLILNRDTYPISRYVLRKVQTIADYSALKANHANVLRLFTMAQLKAAEPTITADVQLEINEAELTKSYWLKNPPQSEPVQNGRKQLTVEWEAYAYFDNFVHKKLGDPSDPIIPIIPEED